MRTLALLLVLANVAFFAWWRHLAPPEDSGEPGRLSQQLDPQKLPVIPAPREGSKVALRGTPCFEWGGFVSTDLARAEQALQALALSAPPILRQVQESTAWWVFIPPLGSREAALKKAAELKALGVDEYFIVQEEGAARWAISLGIFRSEELAQNRLEALRAKRVRTAQLGTRASHSTRAWLQARELSAEQIARLEEIAKQFGGTEIRACANSSF